MKCESPKCSDVAIYDLKLRSVHIIYFCRKHGTRWQHEKDKALAEIERKNKYEKEEDEFWL